MKAKEIGKRDIAIDIIADNGGGITLQCHGDTLYKHSYDNAEQVIDDLCALARGDDPSGWDGNEYNAEPDPSGYCNDMQEYSYDDVRNGGYRWYRGAASQILSELAAATGEEESWRNVRDLIRHAKETETDE